MLTGSRIRPIAESTRPVWHPVLEVLRWVSPLGWTVLGVGAGVVVAHRPLRLGRAARWSPCACLVLVLACLGARGRPREGAHPGRRRADPGHRGRPGHRPDRGHQHLAPRTAAAPRRAAGRRHRGPLRAAPARRRARPRGAVRRADPRAAAWSRSGRPRRCTATRSAWCGAPWPGPSAPSCSSTRSPSRSRAWGPGCCATSRAGDARPVDVRPRLPRAARVPARRRPPLHPLALAPPSTAGCSCGSSSTPGARTWRSSSTPAPSVVRRGATDDVELPSRAPPRWRCARSSTSRTPPSSATARPPSRTTAPLTLDALARAEVGPVDVFGLGGRGVGPGARRERGGARHRRARPFIQLQRTLGQFEPEVIKVAIVVDDDQQVGRPPGGRPRPAARARAPGPAPGAVLGSPGMSGWPPPRSTAGRPRRPGSRPRCAAARPAGHDARVTPTSRGAGDGWCRPGTPWSTRPSPPCWSPSPWSGCAPVSSGRSGWWPPAPGCSSAWRSATWPAVFAWLAVTTLVVLAAIYFLLGGPLAVRTDLVGGVLPTWQTFIDLATWAVLGWKRWLTLLPPVDARGPVLALPWLAGLLGGAVTLGVARRWSIVPLTAVAPLLLLAGSIALGTLGVGRELRAGGRFRRRARRLADRARPSLEATGAERLGQHGPPRDRRRARRPRRRGRATRGAVPTGYERRGRREVVRTALVPPLDVSQFPSPLPGFRRYTEPNTAALYDEVVLKVAGLPAGCARPVRHPRRLRRPGLGRCRPQHRRRAVPAGRLPHRAQWRRHPGRRHGRRRRRRVRRLLAPDRRRPDPHRVRRAARRRARRPSCGSTPTPTPLSSHAGCWAASATR